MLYAQGLLAFLLPLSVWFFETDAIDRRRMLSFVLLGGATGLYVLWALAAYPTEIYIKANSIVYVNRATNHLTVAILCVVAMCGAMLFSKVRSIVVFGVANLVILLVVSAVKQYALTSLWGAYAGVASLIILVYFWRSSENRPHRYAEAIETNRPNICPELLAGRPAWRNGLLRLNQTLERLHRVRVLSRWR